jgi:hypothetical protein
MEGWTEVIPQTWDADTPQVSTDAAQNNPEGEAVIFVEDEPEEVLQAGAVVSGTEQQEEDRPVPTIQQPATREGQGPLIVWIKARVSTPAVDIMEGNERPGSTADIAAPKQGTATNGLSVEGLPHVLVEEPQQPYLQATGSEQPRSEEE